MPKVRLVEFREAMLPSPFLFFLFLVTWLCTRVWGVNPQNFPEITRTPSGGRALQKIYIDQRKATFLPLAYFYKWKNAIMVNISFHLERPLILIHFGILAHVSLGGHTWAFQWFQPPPLESLGSGDNSMPPHTTYLTSGTDESAL